MNKILLIFTLSLLAFSASSLDAYTQKLLLDLHNVERAYVGIANLTWSTALATTAQEWAEYLASSKSFKHSGQAVGENLAMASIRTNVTAYMFSLWSGEKKSFSNAQPYPDVSTDGGAVGHYTQIIWGRTYEVGCGVANTTSSSYLVCQYLLAGNYLGNYVYKASDVIYSPTSQASSSTNTNTNSGSTTNSTSTATNTTTSGSTNSTSSNSTSSGSSGSTSGSTSGTNSTSSGTGSNSGSSSGSSSNNNSGKKNNNSKKGNTRGGSKRN